MVEQTTPLTEVIEELAASRGIEGLDELAELVSDAIGETVTVREIAGWPPSGFGSDLDAVLHFTEEERVRIVRAFMRTFFPEPSTE